MAYYAKDVLLKSLHLVVGKGSTKSIRMNALVCKCAGTIMWEVDRNIKVTRSVRFDAT